MLIKITFPIILIILSTGITRAQYFESVEKEAERILISLSDGDSLKSSELTKLKNLLTTYVETNSTESNLDISQRCIDSLTNHFTEFESELKNISTDSAFVIFNDWYLHFQNIFYEYSKEKFFSSGKTQILLFSTSMSCYCTLKMSRNQTVELLKFISENPDKYDYWVIDSYWHSELQIEYETLFAPSVLVFDQSNEMILKIEYEEEMTEKLTTFLSGRDKI
jgi:hypothetical protein